MIVFEGNPSKEVRKSVTKLYAKLFTTLAIVFIPIGFVPYILYIALNGTDFYIYMFSIICMVVVPIVAIGLFLLIVPLAKMTLPKRVTIENEYEDGIIETIYLEGENTWHKDINSIIKVVDYGTFYYLCPRMGRFICQKDLLAQGTIEDFEKLFEGKIIRKKQQ